MIAIPNRRVDTAMRAAALSSVGCAIGGVVAFASVGLGACLGLLSAWWLAGGGWRVERVWSPGVVALAGMLSFFTMRYAFVDAGIFVHTLAAVPLAFVVGLLDRPIAEGTTEPFDVWSYFLIIVLSFGGVYLGASFAQPDVNEQYTNEVTF